MAVYGNVENLDAVVLATVMAGARHIDGFSPIVETEQTATGEHITITDKNEVHEFDIRNGSAMAARVEGKTAIFESDGEEYQPKAIADEDEHFESDTVEGALDELAEHCDDLEDRCDDLEAELTEPRAVEYGGTGAATAEDARANLGIGALGALSAELQGNAARVLTVYSRLGQLFTSATGTVTTATALNSMLANSCVMFTHSQAETVRLADAPTNYGIVILAKGISNLYQCGLYFSYGSSPQMWVYTHGETALTSSWRQLTS